MLIASPSHPIPITAWLSLSPSITSLSSSFFFSSGQSAEPLNQQSNANHEQRKSLGTRSLRSTLNYSFNHEPLTPPQRSASLYRPHSFTPQRSSRPESLNFDASVLNFEPATRVSSFRRETKTAQTLSIVMGGFIACWLPFFIFYLLTPFIPSNQVNSLIMSYLTWLGWFNSAINPFIYAFYSPDFRIAFWRLTVKHFSKSRRADFAFQHKWGWRNWVKVYSSHCIL